jgi:hypothetical protein
MLTIAITFCTHPTWAIVIHLDVDLTALSGIGISRTTPTSGHFLWWIDFTRLTIIFAKTFYSDIADFNR